LLFSAAPFTLGPNNYLDNEEMRAVTDMERLDLYLKDGSIESKSQRDRFLTAKMFIIDQNYHAYETSLGKEHDFTNFFGRVTTFGLNAAATAIPVGQTTKVLNAAIAGIGVTKSAFDEEILLKQAVQTIQSQMRTDRAKQAKLMMDRMGCGISQYPFYMALSDLEVYSRAGTFESALASLSVKVAASEARATAEKDAGGARQGTSNLVEVRNRAVEAAEQTPACPLRTQ
jgi:hypothetical protein